MSKLVVCEATFCGCCIFLFWAGMVAKQYAESNTVEATSTLVTPIALASLIGCAFAIKAALSKASTSGSSETQSLVAAEAGKVPASISKVTSDVPDAPPSLTV